MEPPRQPPRPAPQQADYIWCPSCTGEMDVFDERGRELRCPCCGLGFPAVVQLELIQFKGDHPPEEWWEQVGHERNEGRRNVGRPG